MRLPGLYRMSKDGVYPSSVSSFSFWMILSSKWPDPIRFWEVEVACCSIGVVRGVVQVIQNWNTGIPNPTRNSRLG